MSSYLRSSIHTALFSAVLAGGVASAAEPQQTAFIEEIEIVVVTGSYIEGAAEDAALPIDVLRAEDLAKQGSPSMVELVKTIPAVQGVVGEANQYTAGGTSGTANINLRGLGGGRTLVLLNGRRLAPATVGVIGYDVNLLPMAAIGRIEVLKDGAAATYGSDAVAGVVNFITKSGFEGLSLESSYTYIEDSDGDYLANAVYGTKGDNWDFLVSGGYRKRSELATQDREFFTRQTAATNPQGGFSLAGNPGVIVAGDPRLPVTDPSGPRGAFRDPGCAQLGIPSATGACVYQFSAFNNLVEEEEQYQAFAEFNMQFSESLGFHADALYAAHDVPGELASASYAPQQGATLNADGSLTSPIFMVPKTNPGLATILPQLTPAQQAAVNAAQYLTVNGQTWRPFGSGGNPLTGGAKEDERFFEGTRLSMGLNGELSGINWDVSVTYGENRAEINTNDMIVTRMAAALQGLGGPNCTTNTPGANGCLWLNPFSSAIARNPATGVANTVTFDPNNVNTADLANWLFAFNGYEDTSTTLVGDLVLNGQLPFGLGAGDIGWASGIQYRKEGFERDPNDLTDSTLNPCVTSAASQVNPTPSNGCLTANGTQSGVFAFFGPIAPQDLDRNVKAVFGELNVPILENLSAQVAVRYETYGGNVGSTTNPKLSLRWQALDWFGLRGSVGSTFRGPLQTQLVSSPTTGLAFTPAAGTFTTFDTFGNPNLQPEEAFTFNVGMIVKAGGFAATVDYWSYDFENSLEFESGPEIVAAFFGTTAPTTANPNPPNQCGNPAFAGLQGRFTFGGDGTCNIRNLVRTRLNVINGPDQQISGIDASLSYLFDDVLGGDLLIGSDATYTLEYERDAAIVEGIVIQPAADYAGTRGATGIGAGTLPELRGSAYVDYSMANMGVRITSRFIDGVTDVRQGLTGAGVQIGSFLTHDLTYRLSLPAETTLTASVFNFTDRDPPLARLELSYDPFIANPLGRYYRVLLNKRF